MKGHFLSVKLSLVLLLPLVALTTAADEAHLMRYADVHGDWIVFTFEDDLWLVPSSGGDAYRITNHPGRERFAKFSPDGSQIAFTASYDGGTDVYVMDARGGVPHRLTYHPARDNVLGWLPAGDRILYRTRRDFLRGEQLFSIAVSGGMRSPLPVDRAGLASFSPDGQHLAYNRITREERTWKRHRGGTAQDIWVGSLSAGDFAPITDWEGTDNYPMWQGDTIYFTSDRAHGTLNIYRSDPDGGNITALTEYTDYDVKYPSQGPGKIVYQYAESLHLLDLASGSISSVDIRLASDRVPVRDQYVGISGDVGTFGLCNSGETVLLEARGEIITVPVDEGEAKNLTRRSESREKNGAWSPDGKLIAFFSDLSGEEELWLAEVDQPGEWRQLTEGNSSGFRKQPVWSPDSKYLLFSDKTMRLNLVDASTGTVELVAQGDYDDAWYRWGIQDYVWSPDSKWIAYTEMERSGYESIFLYCLSSGEITRLTREDTTDWSPSFDPEGRYLYFLSNRTFNPIMGFVDHDHIFRNLTLAYVVILAAGEPSPFAPSDSSEKADEADEADEADAGDESEAITIDLDGISGRIVVAEGIEAGNYFRLEANSGGFFYLAMAEPGFLKYQEVTDFTGDKLDLFAYDLGEKAATSQISGISNYHLSGDGEKLIYRADQSFGVVDAGKPAKVGDGKIGLGGVKIKVAKLAEFEQIFTEAWRVQRDWFYDPKMHGVDWASIGEKYRRFVRFCGNRGDLNYLIGEMIGELNAGHTYIGGGDFGDRPAQIRVGLLGASFDRPGEADYYRIAEIVPGNSWNPRERSPLEEPGCGIKAGDFLIGIDGDEVQASKGDNVYSFLQRKVGKTVTLSYSSQPSAQGASTCRITPIAREGSLRYRAWVDSNRALVDKMSGGTLGYVHIPDMMSGGLIEFARTFYPQHYKKGLVIDVRNNGGGFVGSMIIDRLERKVWSLTFPREGKSAANPERCLHGHLAVLINADTGSNGEFFAATIRVRQLAPLIGKRTWGGSVGIEPHQDLVDGAVTTPPQFGLGGLDRTWLIEGRGVDPDIEVENLPSEVLAGRDSQLEAGVKLLLGRLQEDPKELPGRPDFINKSKAAGDP